jgi:hypothetical protein
LSLAQTQTAVITTWLVGSHLNGTLSCLNVFATLSDDGELVCSAHKYSTPEGARRAARKRGLKVLRYVAPGHAAAKRRLQTAATLEAQADHAQELAGIRSVAGLI